MLMTLAQTAQSITRQVNEIMSDPRIWGAVLVIAALIGLWILIRTLRFARNNKGMLATIFLLVGAVVLMVLYLDMGWIGWVVVVGVLAGCASMAGMAVAYRK